MALQPSDFFKKELPNCFTCLIGARKAHHDVNYESLLGGFLFHGFAEPFKQVELLSLHV